MSDVGDRAGESRITLTPLSRLEADLVPYEWEWARENADAIRQTWERRRAARPSMFDGRVLLACGFAIRGESCTVALFETRYSNFIAFRDAGSPDPGVHNAFAAIVPHSADGAVLLGVMAAHTANAGQIYFPCGTPDLEDVRPGAKVDLAGSAEREFSEETGLALPPGAEDAPWLLARGEGQLAFLRPVHFGETAATLLARIAAHHAGEAHPELAGMLALRPGDAIDRARKPGFVRAYLDRSFGISDRLVGSR